MHYTTSHALKLLDDSNVAVTLESSPNFWKDVTFFFSFTSISSAKLYAFIDPSIKSHHGANHFETWHTQ